MSMLLPLPSEIEVRLTQEASRLGVTPAEHALQLLDQHLPQNGRAADLAALLQSWIDSPEAEEQQQTGDYLVEALDQDRPLQRKFYPPELKGISW